MCKNEVLLRLRVMRLLFDATGSPKNPRKMLAALCKLGKKKVGLGPVHADVPHSFETKMVATTRKHYNQQSPGNLQEASFLAFLDTKIL